MGHHGRGHNWDSVHHVRGGLGVSRDGCRLGLDELVSRGGGHNLGVGPAPSRGPGAQHRLDWLVDLDLLLDGGLALCPRVRLLHLLTNWLGHGHSDQASESLSTYNHHHQLRSHRQGQRIDQEEEEYLQ